MRRCGERCSEGTSTAEGAEIREGRERRCLAETRSTQRRQHRNPLNLRVLRLREIISWSTVCCSPGPAIGSALPRRERPAATNLLRVAAHVIIPASPYSSTDYGNSRIHQAPSAEREESIHGHGFRSTFVVPHARHAPVELTSARVSADREVGLG